MTEPVYYAALLEADRVLLLPVPGGWGLLQPKVKAFPLPMVEPFSP